jgi:hypothetical protein
MKKTMITVAAAFIVMRMASPSSMQHDDRITPQHADQHLT